jgi:Zn-dependent M28 family amino/carboxypeptidase
MLDLLYLAVGKYTVKQGSYEQVCHVILKQQLESHLHLITRERDPYIASAGHFFVQQYIYEQFSRFGSVEIHTFIVGGKTYKNLILNLPSSGALEKSGLPPILIAAHYDAVPGSPGADDNATGVAVLLELARMFATEPAKYPVRLVAFDMEEYGLLGSTDYVRMLKEQQQPLRLMIGLEMLGYYDATPGSQKYPHPLQYFYPSQGNFIALIGNLKTLFDLIRISRSIGKVGVSSQCLPVPNKGLIVKDTRRSDHAPFWDAGYPAIMVTDTANMRNPNYHKPSDKIETLNLDFLTGVCEGLFKGIGRL